MAIFTAIKNRGGGSGALGGVLRYVQQKEKTTWEDRRLVSGWNCTARSVYDEMRLTKEQFHKTDGRQYYSIPALQDKVSGSCTGTSAEWTALCRRESTYRISQSRSQILKKSSDCWHKTQQADSFRCPPVCLTIQWVQKVYLWELSEVVSFFFVSDGLCPPSDPRFRAAGLRVRRASVVRPATVLLLLRVLALHAQHWGA